MLSTKQVTYAAMANGWDDVFMMNNLCFAFIGLLMSWQAILTAVKGELLLECTLAFFGFKADNDVSSGWATMRMAGH